MTLNEKIISELWNVHNQLDHIRLEFVTNREEYMKNLRDSGFSSTEALKDWQGTFARILNAMDQCIAEIRQIINR